MDITTPMESEPLAAGSLRARAIALGGLLLGAPALSLVDQAVVSATNFFTTVIIGRMCGPEELGTYSLGFTLLLLLSAIHAALIGLPYTMFGNRLAGPARAEYAGAVLIHHAGLTLLAMAIMAAAAGLASAGLGPAGLAPMMWMLVGATAFTLLREFARRLAFAHLQMRTVLVLDTVASALQIAGLVWLGARGTLGAATAYAVVGAACAVTGLWWLAQSRGSFSVRWAGAIAELGRNWAFGRWVFAGAVTYTLQGYSIQWILALALGTGATGVLAACTTVVMFFNPILVAASNVVAPQNAQAFVTEGPAGVRRVVGRVTLLLGLAMAAYACLVALIGQQVVHVLYHGSAYDGNQHLINVLTLGMLASVLGSASDSGLCALERPDMNFKANLLGLAATVIVTIFLLAPLGVLGAAYGLLAGSAASSLARAAAFLRIAYRPAPASG